MGYFLGGLCALRGEFYCLRYSNETVMSGQPGGWVATRCASFNAPRRLFIGN